MKHLFYIILFTCLPLTPQISEATQFQPLSSIHSAIDQYIVNHFKTSNHYDYTLSQLDPRLRLPLCIDTLQVSTQTSTLKSGQNSIAVHCTSGTRWTIYTSAKIRSYQKVLVLTQPISRGEIITEKSLSYKDRDVGELRQGYLLNSVQVINKQAKRNLAAGIVINNNQFTEPKLIKRGEKVNIQAKSPFFNISMAGIAMMDGKKGQNIRVKNIRSKRIIQATVLKRGQVSVY